MADILLAIPDLIEHIYSCVKFAQAYSKIDENFSSDIDHVVRVSKTVSIMTELVRHNRVLQTESEIVKSLKKLERVLSELHIKLEEWKIAMNFREAGPSVESELGRSSPSNIEAEKSTGLEELEMVGSISGVIEDGEAIVGKFSLGCGILGLRWFRSIFSFSTWRERKRPRRNVKHNAGISDTSQGYGEKPSQANVVFEAFNRAKFVSVVGPDIKDILQHVDRALEDLVRFFNLSMMFSRIVFNDEAREFVEKARMRLAVQSSVQHLVIPPSSLEPLDKAFQGETEFPQSLFYVRGGEYGGCLIDRRYVRHLVNEGRTQEIMADTERVARMMAEDPQDKKGITSALVPVLRSCGISFPDRDGDMHDIVFRLPRGYQEPFTLRRALVSPGRAPNLRTRATLAFHLATALDIIHRLDVVHKRVRPESIVLLRHVDDDALSSDSCSPSIGMPFLAGFTYSRHEVGDSNMKPIYGSEVPELIYHHPRHLDLARVRQQSYQKHDDIYSLGICLLEIGLWRSIVRWDEEQLQYILDDFWKLDYEHYATLSGNSLSNIWFHRRSDLIELAKCELPQSMGPSYAEVVITCLKFDEKNERARSLVDGTCTAGADFIRDVVSKLFELKF